MSTTITNKPTRRAIEADNLLELPPAPTDKPPMLAGADAPTTTPQFVPGQIPGAPTLRGSVLQQSAMLLSFDGVGVISPSMNPRAAAFPQEIDGEARRQIRAAVAGFDNAPLHQFGTTSRA